MNMEKKVSHRTQIESLAKKLGVTLLDRDSTDNWSWNGHNIATNNWDDESFILHEIAHWILCSEDRLSIPDFGLGIGPRSVLFAPSVLNYDDDLHEELCASVLGILYERAFGMKWKEAYHYQSWTGEGSDFLKYVNTLKKLGLVHRGGRPVVI